jgi:hypothetical protein
MYALSPEKVCALGAGEGLIAIAAISSAALKLVMGMLSPSFAQGMVCRKK